MFKTCIIGASGYTGAELIEYLLKHEHFSQPDLFVSSNSADAQRTIDQLYPQFINRFNAPLQALDEACLASYANDYDAIFLATPHEASHNWVPTLATGKAKIFDLSGAYRLPDATIFERYYGFPHQHPDIQSQAVYGLVDWAADAVSEAKIVAVPGCYPTASLLALKPLTTAGLIKAGTIPVINATSGVSGAGRKASMTNSFCEVSLQAYGILSHRHMPEIETYLAHPVVFTPHLGNFKRGILATVTAQVNPGVSNELVQAAFHAAYANAPAVRLRERAPKLDEVVQTPYCDLFVAMDEDKGVVVITSAIDNLLKGASAQAMQCANLAFGFDVNSAILA